MKTERVVLTRELPGRLAAYRIAEVRARISGIVLRREFTEGANVKEGELLFVIDPAPYEAALDSARATLAKARAGLASARAQAERFKGLVATHAVSKQSYDDAVAAELSLTAEVSAAEAAVRAAEINLGYTKVTAPIAGRVGRAEVTEGAYAQQGAATLLAVVQQLDPLYVDLNEPADEVLRLKAALADGALKREDNQSQAKLTLVLQNGRTFAKSGTLGFADVSVNTSTGTVLLRGTIPNPDLDLLPGMFVRAQIEEGENPAAILVPQSLVSRNARGDGTVLVVGTDNQVTVRTVTANRNVGNRWLITDGLKAGDRIVADSLQRVRPGMIIKPVAPPPPAVPAPGSSPR